jgi:hypothetical protein
MEMKNHCHGMKIEASQLLPLYLLELESLSLCESVQRTVQGFCFLSGSRYRWYRKSLKGKRGEYKYYPVRIAECQKELCQDYKGLKLTEVKNTLVIEYLGYYYKGKNKFESVSPKSLFPTDHAPDGETDAPPVVATGRRRWSLSLMSSFLENIRHGNEFKGDTLENLRVEHLYLDALLNQSAAAAAEPEPDEDDDASDIPSQDSNAAPVTITPTEPVEEPLPPRDPSYRPHIHAGSVVRYTNELGWVREATVEKVLTLKQSKDDCLELDNHEYVPRDGDVRLVRQVLGPPLDRKLGSYPISMCRLDRAYNDAYKQWVQENKAKTASSQRRDLFLEFQLQEQAQGQPTASESNHAAVAAAPSQALASASDHGEPNEAETDKQQPEGPSSRVGQSSEADSQTAAEAVEDSANTDPHYGTAALPKSGEVDTNDDGETTEPETEKPGSQLAGASSEASDNRVEPSHNTDDQVGAPVVAVGSTARVRIMTLPGEVHTNSGDDTVTLATEKSGAQPVGTSKISDSRVEPDRSNKTEVGTPGAAVGSRVPVPLCGSTKVPPKSGEADANDDNGGEVVLSHESDEHTFASDSGAGDTKPPSQATLQPALQTSAETGSTKRGNAKRTRNDGAPFRKTRSRTQKIAPPPETSGAQVEQSNAALDQTGPPPVAVESRAAVSRGSTTPPPETVEPETEKPAAQPVGTSKTSDSRVEPDQSNKTDDLLAAPLAAVGSSVPVPPFGSTKLPPRSGEADADNGNGGEVVLSHESDEHTFASDSGAGDTKPPSQATLKMAPQPSAVTGTPPPEPTTVPTKEELKAIRRQERKTDDELRDKIAKMVKYKPPVGENEESLPWDEDRGRSIALFVLGY